MTVIKYKTVPSITYSARRYVIRIYYSITFEVNRLRMSRWNNLCDEDRQV